MKDSGRFNHSTIAGINDFFKKFEARDLAAARNARRDWWYRGDDRLSRSLMNIRDFDYPQRGFKEFDEKSRYMYRADKASPFRGVKKVYKRIEEEDLSQNLSDRLKEKAVYRELKERDRETRTPGKVYGYSTLKEEVRKRTNDGPEIVEVREEIRRIPENGRELVEVRETRGFTPELALKIKEEEVDRELKALKGGFKSNAEKEWLYSGRRGTPDKYRSYLKDYDSTLDRDGNYRVKYVPVEYRSNGPIPDERLHYKELKEGARVLPDERRHYAENRDNMDHLRRDEVNAELERVNLRRRKDLDTPYRYYFYDGKTHPKRRFLTPNRYETVDDAFFKRFPNDMVKVEAVVQGDKYALRKLTDKALRQSFNNDRIKIDELVTEVTPSGDKLNGKFRVFMQVPRKEERELENFLYKNNLRLLKKHYY